MLLTLVTILIIACLSHHVESAQAQYQIYEQIGRGSIGRVYRGRRIDDPTQTDLAIKIADSDDWQTRREIEFVKQYSMAGRPGQLPGLVVVLDVFAKGLSTYMVMELVPGSTLQSWAMVEGRHDVYGSLVWIVFQMLAVMKQIHEVDYEYGDLAHLNNFMVDTTDNSLVLLDFGRIARHRSGPNSDLYSIYGLIQRVYDGAINKLDVRPMSIPEIRLWDKLADTVKSWRTKMPSCGEAMRNSIFDGVRSRAIPLRMGPTSFRDLNTTI